MATLQDKSENELLSSLGEKKLALRTFRFAGSGSKTRNVKEGKALRKDIARILTEIGARKRKGQ